MRRILKSVARFAIALAVMTIVCVVVWQELVAKRLYHCSYSLGGFDFLQSGDWVHGAGSPSGDTIRDGWSLTGLWCLWLSLFGISVLVSLLLALRPWRSRRSIELKHDTAA
jgi:hypothetical protein